MPRVTALTVSLLLLASAGCGDSAPVKKTPDEQMQAAMKISDPARRTSELLRIADRQVKAGEVADVRSTLLTAIESARTIQIPAERAMSLASVSAAYARIGETEGSKKLLKETVATVREFESNTAKIAPLISMATVAAAEFGDTAQAAAYLQEAESAATEIEFARLRANSLGRISAAYERIDLLRDAERLANVAIDWANGLDTPREKSECLAEIAAALYKTKLAPTAQTCFDRSREVAAGIESSESRAYAFVFVARKLKEAGDMARANAVKAEARQIADQITDSSVRNPLLEKINE